MKLDRANEVRNRLASVDPSPPTRDNKAWPRSSASSPFKCAAHLASPQRSGGHTICRAEAQRTIQNDKATEHPYHQPTNSKTFMPSGYSSGKLSTSARRKIYHGRRSSRTTIKIPRREVRPSRRSHSMKGPLPTREQKGRIKLGRERKRDGGMATISARCPSPTAHCDSTTTGATVTTPVLHTLPACLAPRGAHRVSPAAAPPARTHAHLHTYTSKVSTVAGYIHKQLSMWPRRTSRPDRTGIPPTPWVTTAAHEISTTHFFAYSCGARQRRLYSI